MDNVEQFESELIEKVRGGLVYCKQGKYAKLYNYDTKMAYGSVLCDENFKIPVRVGEMGKITNEDIAKWKTFQYGIYHLKVEENELFRKNYNDIYTHYELNYAKSHKLDISVFDDDEQNCLLYRCVGDNKKVVSSSKLFGEFIQNIYKYKEENKKNKDDEWYKTLKLIGSSFWGFASKGNKISKIMKDDTMEVKKGEYVYNMMQKNNCIKYYIKNVNQIYSSPIARMKPFILSLQRIKILEEIEKSGIENIVYVRTDGFYSTKKLDYPTTGDMGDIICKGEVDNVLIENVNSVKVVGKTYKKGIFSIDDYENFIF